MPRKYLSGKKHRASLGEVTLIHPSTLNLGLYRCPLFKLSVLEPAFGEIGWTGFLQLSRGSTNRLEKRPGKALQGGISNAILRRRIVDEPSPDASIHLRILFYYIKILSLKVIVRLL
jgi:hypothetical protein